MRKDWKDREVEEPSDGSVKGGGRGWGKEEKMSCPMPPVHTSLVVHKCYVHTISSLPATLLPPLPLPPQSPPSSSEVLAPTTMNPAQKTGAAMQVLLSIRLSMARRRA